MTLNDSTSMQWVILAQGQQAQQHMTFATHRFIQNYCQSHINVDARLRYISHHQILHLQYKTCGS